MHSHDPYREQPERFEQLQIVATTRKMPTTLVLYIFDKNWHLCELVPLTGYRIAYIDFVSHCTFIRGLYNPH